MLGFSITLSVGGSSEQTHSGARRPSDPWTVLYILSLHISTPIGLSSPSMVTHGPAGQGDGSSAEVVAVVKERLVQGHLSWVHSEGKCLVTTKRLAAQDICQGYLRVVGFCTVMGENSDLQGFPKIVNVISHFGSSFINVLANLFTC